MTGDPRFATIWVQLVRVDPGVDPDATDAVNDWWAGLTIASKMAGLHPRDWSIINTHRHTDGGFVVVFRMKKA